MGELCLYTSHGNNIFLGATALLPKTVRHFGIPWPKFEVRTLPLRPPRLISWRCPIQNIRAHTYMDSHSPFSKACRKQTAILYFHRPRSRPNEASRLSTREARLSPISLTYLQGKRRAYFIEEQEHWTIIDIVRWGNDRSQLLGVIKVA